MVTLLETVALVLEEKAWLFVKYALKEQFSNYAVSLYKDLPVEIFEGFLSILCVGVLAIILFDKRGWRKIVGMLLVEYVFLIYCSTVIFRKYSEERGFNLSPFWSYEAIRNGNEILLPQNIMNVIVFIPIGGLLCLLFSKGTWWKTIGMGCFISMSIEALQYIFKHGFCEVDDVIHNTLGCAIGCGIASLLKYAYSGIKKYRKAENTETELL